MGKRLGAVEIEVVEREAARETAAEATGAGSVEPDEAAVTELTQLARRHSLAEEADCDRTSESEVGAGWGGCTEGGGKLCPVGRREKSSGANPGAETERVSR